MPPIHPRRSWSWALVGALALPLSAASAATVPRFDHVVIVVEENKAAGSIIGNLVDAPYLNALAASGANFSDAHAVTHPSQPNYLALFSGSTQGVSRDDCPQDFRGVANLGQQLLAAGWSFAGYSEDLPQAGYRGCSSARYARKHNPWVDFDNVPSTANLPFTAFPSDFRNLPTVSFVVPNLCNDMHDCPIATGDAWLHTHLDAYAQWARLHNSLLIVIWDENDSLSSSNQIPLLFAGAQIKPGRYNESIDHYDVLATLQRMYDLAPLGGGAAIVDIWEDGIFSNGFERSDG